MTLPQWIPRTFEDNLIELYLAENAGLLFLEVEVGAGDAYCGPRRLDGLLIPGERTQIIKRGFYSRNDIATAINNKHVQVIEAKRKLGRGVIGQVQVGAALLKKEFSPASVQGVALYARGNPDLEFYCSDEGIRTALYSELYPLELDREYNPQAERKDLRQPPDAVRRGAFMRGWNAAVDGTLYQSVLNKKTHGNIGNLFGWIYGDKSADFKLEVWESYVSSLE